MTGMLCSLAAGLPCLGAITARERSPQHNAGHEQLRSLSKLIFGVCDVDGPLICRCDRRRQPQFRALTKHLRIIAS